VGNGEHGEGGESSGGGPGLNAAVRTEWLTGSPTQFHFFPDYPKLVKIYKIKMGAFQCSTNSQIFHDTILKCSEQLSQLFQLQIPNKYYVKKS
jgi:hypothetical protein